MLSSLPLELQYLIYSYLKLQDLIHCCTINKALYKIGSSIVFWHTYFNYNNVLLPNKEYKTLQSWAHAFNKASKNVYKTTIYVALIITAEDYNYHDQPSIILLGKTKDLLKKEFMDYLALPDIKSYFLKKQITYDDIINTVDNLVEEKYESLYWDPIYEVVIKKQFVRNK